MNDGHLWGHTLIRVSLSPNWAVGQLRVREMAHKGPFYHSARYEDAA